ncbi:hypothetical protein [Labilibaculum euxinus]
MIEKIKERFGPSAQVLAVQEYFTVRWNKYESALLIEDQISECIAIGAAIVSFHITVEEIDKETGEHKVIDAFPDVRV